MKRIKRAKVQLVNVSAWEMWIKSTGAASLDPANLELKFRIFPLLFWRFNGKYLGSRALLQEKKDIQMYLMWVLHDITSFFWVFEPEIKYIYPLKSGKAWNVNSLFFD